MGLALDNGNSSVYCSGTVVADDADRSVLKWVSPDGTLEKACKSSRAGNIENIEYLEYTSTWTPRSGFPYSGTDKYIVDHSRGWVLHLP